MDENKQYYKLTEVCDMLERQPVQIAKHYNTLGINFRYVGGQRCLHCADVSMLAEYIKSDNATEDKPPVHKEEIDSRGLIRLGYDKIALAENIKGTDDTGFYSCDIISLNGEKHPEYAEAKNIVFISDRLYDTLLKEVCKLHKYQDLVKESLVAAYRANSGKPAYIIRHSKMNEKPTDL